MISTTVTNNTQVIIEHLDDASDCCREAAETLEHIGKYSRQIDVKEICDQLADLRLRLTSLRASVHRDAYPANARKANSVFPISHPSHLVPLS